MKLPSKALPFGFQSRTVWYIGFYTTCAALFSIPFVNLEINVSAARADARKKQEELKEQIRAESPSVKW
ncbi:hypothetical protein HDU79_008157 [Rhizoclosmatium sp. JEL0117]|nr:hypothetical protein HDU79_008157 [Rhizoclosmatium sp. JEL0117]